MASNDLLELLYGQKPSGDAFVGYPAGKKYAGAKRRAEQADVNTLPDPKTYAAVQSFLGTAPDQLGFSALHPKAGEIRDVADKAYALGLLTNVAPMTKGLPVGASIKKAEGSTQPFWHNPAGGQHVPFDITGMHNAVIQDPAYAAKLGVTTEEAMQPTSTLLMGRTERKNPEALNLMQIAPPTPESIEAIKAMLQKQQLPHKTINFSAGENLFEGVPVDELLKAEGLAPLKSYQQYAGGGEVKTPNLLSVSPYAETVAYEMYPGQAGQDDRRDAARHMLAAGTLSRKYGPGVAEFLGKAHEWATSPWQALKYALGAGQMPSDYEMDLHNNAVGINAAKQAKDQADLERLIMQSAERASKTRTPGVAYIKKAEGGSVEIPNDFTMPDMSDGGQILPDPEFASRPPLSQIR